MDRDFKKKFKNIELIDNLRPDIKFNDENSSNDIDIQTKKFKDNEIYNPRDFFKSKKDKK